MELEKNEDRGWRIENRPIRLSIGLFRSLIFDIPSSISWS
jgi:hypothetical protein